MKTLLRLSPLLMVAVSLIAGPAMIEVGPDREISALVEARNTIWDNWIADPEFERRHAVTEDFWAPSCPSIDGAEGYRTWRTDEPEIQEEFAGNHLTPEAPGTLENYPKPE
jgi:hypothetical protein